MNAARLQTTIRQSVTFARNWAPTAAMWGATATGALLFAIQPSFLFKHLPIIGDRYLTAKDIQAAKKKAEEQ
ncbi:hypothetical protein SAMD00019534_126160 [Acytostelium subglobosum LB1]|uniref:hypothetical protein n=1 Tax=Acytostelium subglobosum LB1 TaxID=1410327 RepID=UPI000644F3F1|nr:hypothetical protein SAMD00019534_126160 [Acytostelium subglobosum LB1]GAM29440.1 hypothetical protein SAMD00019534_126160 [Acytostelium subglobosum LB1]|eukprot:XP_012747616.1 hypothetical protein SAMD00019534_126160 [Acytostelium subglobosum LB1]